MRHIQNILSLIGLLLLLPPLLAIAGFAVGVRLAVKMAFADSYELLEIENSLKTVHEKLVEVNSLENK